MIGIFANCKAHRRISVLRSSAAFKNVVWLPFAPCQKVIQLANLSVIQMNTAQFSHMHIFWQIQIHPCVSREEKSRLRSGVKLRPLDEHL